MKTKRELLVKKLDTMYKKRREFEIKAKPLCPNCNTENSYEQYLGTHAPYTMYKCKKCESRFIIDISLLDGRIRKTYKGGF